MAALDINKVDELGTGNLTFEALSANDTFVNTGKEFIILKGHASTANTVVFSTQITHIRHPNYGNTTKADISITLGAGQTHIVGPFKPNAYNTSSNTVAVATTPASGTDRGTCAVCYLDDR